MTFKVVVDDPAHPFVEPDTSEQDSTGDTSAVALRDFGMCPLGAFQANEPVQAFDVQGHYLGAMREEKVRSLNAGVYLLRAGKNVRKVRVE